MNEPFNTLQNRRPKGQPVSHRPGRALLLHCYSFFDLFEMAGDDPTKFMMVLLHLVDSCWWLSVYLHCHRADCSEENLPIGAGATRRSPLGCPGKHSLVFPRRRRICRNPVSSTTTTVITSTPSALNRRPASTCCSGRWMRWRERVWTCWCWVSAMAMSISTIARWPRGGAAQGGVGELY